MLAPSTPKMYSTPALARCPTIWSTTRYFLGISGTRSTPNFGSTSLPVNQVASGYVLPPVQDVIVVGAGPAGLAVARELGHRHAISALVVEKSAAPAVSWRNRY